MNSKQELQAYEAGQRAAAAHFYRAADAYLTTCDDIILDIERIQLEIAKADEPTRAIYGDALEMRERALERRQTPPLAVTVVAATTEAMKTARLALEAVHALIAVEHRLTPERPKHTLPEV